MFVGRKLQSSTHHPIYDVAVGIYSINNVFHFFTKFMRTKVSTSLYYISLSLGFGNIAQGGDPL